MKYLTLILLAVLAGCGSSAEPMYFSKVPTELSDCRIWRLRENSTYITVARCPNSTTSVTTHTKGSPTSITVDGVEYAPVVK